MSRTLCGFRISCEHRQAVPSGLDERSARKGARTSSTPHECMIKAPGCPLVGRLRGCHASQTHQSDAYGVASPPTTHPNAQRSHSSATAGQDNMAAQITAKELAKMVQLCGRAEDQGIIDDEDVKQLIKAMDDAALPTLVREENWRKAHERRKKRNNKPETPQEDRYVPFYEKEARLDNAVRMLQDKLTANTPKGEALKLFKRAAHGNDTLPVAELIPSLRETLRISEADLSQMTREHDQAPLKGRRSGNWTWSG